MFDELVKTVRLHLSERLTSPLFGAFIASWSAWNYRLILIIFSSEPIEIKLTLIDKVVFPDHHQTIIRGIVFPTITSLAYLFIYPYPAKYVYAFTRRKQREILEIRRNIEDETPLTIEDSRKIRTELAKAEQSYFEELERKDREIEKLRVQLAPSEITHNLGPISNLESDQKIQEEKLDDRLIKLLLLVEHFSGQPNEQALISSSGMSRTETEYYLGELVRMGLLERNYKSARSAYVYTFTHSGRAALIKAQKELSNG